MEAYHEIVCVFDHHTEEKRPICMGFLVVVPEYKDKALIIVRNMFLDNNEKVTTEEGLVLNHWTRRGENFLWSFEGLDTQSAKGHAAVE